MRLLVLTLAGASELLGAPLRQEGFSLRPPSEFRMAAMDLFRGTRVGAVGAAGTLQAALVDGDGEDAASMLLSVVEGPFRLEPGGRDALSTAVLRHFRDELGQQISLESAEVGGGRVEVTGSVREGSQLRQVLVAAFPGEHRHVVAVFSVPSGRWATLREAVRASLDSFRAETASPRGWVFAIPLFVAALLLMSVGLWRRQRRQPR